MTLLSQVNAATYQQAVASSFFQSLGVPTDTYAVQLAPHIYLEGHSSIRPPHFGNFQLFQSTQPRPVYVAALFAQTERFAAEAARPDRVSENAGHYMFVGTPTAADRISFVPARIETTSRSDVTSGRIMSSLSLHDFGIDALIRLGRDDMLEFKRDHPTSPYSLAYWLGGSTLASRFEEVSDPDELYDIIAISGFHFFSDAPFLNYYHTRKRAGLSSTPPPDEEITQRIDIRAERVVPPPPPLPSIEPVRQIA